jgi:hypothetical protein
VRCAFFGDHPCAASFDWLAEPILNGLTRLAVETSPATGDLRVLGLEPTSKRMAEAAPVTNRLEVRITAGGSVHRHELRAA